MNRKVSLKVRHYFDASHHLKDYDGVCAREHGHRFNVTVFAEGSRLINNILIDFGKIKGEINKLDHQNLNELLNEENPTAEFLCDYLILRFEQMYPEIKFKVRIFESPNASAEVQSDGFGS